MGNNGQEHEKIDSVSDIHVSVDKSKRRFSKAGIATPIIMTLASKPVFAVQGLSNMLSGTGSGAGFAAGDGVCVRGDNRYGGMSPGFWKTPKGDTEPFGDPVQGNHPKETRLGAWEIAGYSYGTWWKGLGNDWADYKGGTDSPDSRLGDINTPLREILNNNPTTLQFHLIAGFLNACYFDAKAASSGNTTEYIFTRAEFWDMLNNPTSYFTVNFPFSSLQSLIETNYHKYPLSIDPTKVPCVI